MSPRHPILRLLALWLGCVGACAGASAQCTVIQEDFEGVPFGTVLTTLNGWSATSSTPFTVQTSLFSGTSVATVDLPPQGVTQVGRSIPPVAQTRGRVSIDLDISLEIEVFINCGPNATQVGKVGSLFFRCDQSGNLTVGSRGVVTVVPSGLQTLVYEYDVNGMIAMTYAGIPLDAYPWSFGVGTCPTARQLALFGAQPIQTQCSGVLELDNVLIESRIGANYCSAVANSTGRPATLCAGGSDSLAAGELILQSRALPPFTTVLFLVSSAQGLVLNPGGSTGHLCLGGSIGRFVGPGEVQTAGPLGIAGITLDLGRLPTPNGFVSAVPGETWSFQAWYRDQTPSGASATNFVPGIAVVVAP